MNRLLTSTIFATGVALAAPALAQTTLPPIDVRQPHPFELGQLRATRRHVDDAPAVVAQPAPAARGRAAAHSSVAAATAPTPVRILEKDNGPTPLQRFDSFGGVSLSNRQMETFARDSLDKSVNLVPGVNALTTGGPRNEQNIYVRGFDRWQVPLTIDGIRVFLPADNRLDFARFMTPDIAEVQIAKGYVSVLEGPGGMGGQINLVTRRPQKEIEAELRTGVEFGRDGTYEGPKTYGFLGTKRDLYYAQVSGSWRELKGWMLPESYRSTANQGWGFRNNSQVYDWNINARIGVTPNATDEYSLSYMRQDGKKGVPFHITDPVASQRYWTWPYWQIQNLYWLSNTKLGDTSYVRTKAYWNKFDNSIISYDDPFLLTQTSTKSFNSRYTDYALGGSVEVGTEIAKVDTLKGMFEYRFDDHGSWQEYFGLNAFGKTGAASGCTANVVCFTQPVTHSQEDTYSAGFENTYRPTKDIDLVQGFSYDWRHLRQAQDFNSSGVLGSLSNPFGVVSYTPKDAHGPNFQGAAIWRYNETDKVYANVSDRMRFPTLFERFSTRFGGATSNPTLSPERAVNIDIGWGSNFAPGSHVQIDVFHSIVRNLIQSVPVPAYGAGVTQSQNVGSGNFWGAEISGDHRVRDDFSIGGNVTIQRRGVYAPYIIGFQPIGVPDLKINLFAGYRPLPNLTLTPSLEINSSRWTSSTQALGGFNLYYRTGAVALVNFQGDWQVTPNIKLTAGVRNLFDQLYKMTDGFPEPGRSMYVGAKATF